MTKRYTAEVAAEDARRTRLGSDLCELVSDALGDDEESTRVMFEYDRVSLSPSALHDLLVALSDGRISYTDVDRITARHKKGGA